MAVPAGFDKEQVKYNVYAFGRDVRKFTRKRDAARKPHTRAHWQKKVDEYTIYLNDNKGWLAELEAAEHSVRADVCRSCGTNFVLHALYCHHCGTRR